MGVYGYVGIPQSGKTTLAIAHANARGRYVVLDFMYANTFMAWPVRVESVDKVLAAIRAGQCPAWSPEEPYEEVTELCARLKTMRAGVSLLIDEAWNVWRSNWTLKGLGGHLRATQHHGGDVFYTTQRYGDLGGDALTCTTRLYIFRSKYRRDLDRLEEETRIPRATLETIPQFHCYPIEGGFTNDSKPDAADQAH